jgi:hypothetical protein
MSRQPATRARNAVATIAANKHALAAATMETPLGYALRIMRDQDAPMNLRAGMAKAALPYLHWRLPTGVPPEPETETPELSRTEIARRIAFLLDSDDGGAESESTGASASSAPPAATPSPAKSETGSEAKPAAPEERKRKPYAPPPVHYITDEVRRDQIVSPRVTLELPTSYARRTGYRRLGPSS